MRVADSGFDPVGQMRYSPYGGHRNSPSDLPVDDLFTGQKWDNSISLYWYGSRAYDPSLGRFTCPDTVVPSPANPQALNRYAYGYNRPLTFTDPSGHIPFDESGIIDTTQYKDAYGNTIEPSYLPVEIREAIYYHNMGISNPGGGGGRDGGSSGGGGGQRLPDKIRVELLKMLIEPGGKPTGDPASDTARFINDTEQLKSYYRQDEAGAFVRDMGLLFGGIRRDDTAIGAVMRWKNDETGGRVQNSFMYLSSDGMQEAYRDSEQGHHEENQTHHYVAFLMLGYEYGTAAATAINVGLDGFGFAIQQASQGKWGVNSGDIALGNLAAMHGNALRGWRNSLDVSSGPAVVQMDYQQLVDAMRRDLLA